MTKFENGWGIHTREGLSRFGTLAESLVSRSITVIYFCSGKNGYANAPPLLGHAYIAYLVMFHSI
jgi:hypothetical protein